MAIFKGRLPIYTQPPAVDTPTPAPHPPPGVMVCAEIPQERGLGGGLAMIAPPAPPRDVNAPAVTAVVVARAEEPRPYAGATLYPRPPDPSGDQTKPTAPKQIVRAEELLPEPGSVLQVYRPTVSTLKARPSILVGAEAAPPHPGAVIHSVNRAWFAPMFAQKVITYSEAPAAAAGVVLVGTLPAIDVSPVALRKLIVAAEPPRPAPGTVLQSPASPARGGPGPVGTVVVARSEAPRPSAGTVLAGIPPLPAPTGPIGGVVVMARAEQPRAEQLGGVLVQAIGRPVAVAPSPAGTSVIAQAEAPRPFAGGVLVGVPPALPWMIRVVVMARAEPPRADFVGGIVIQAIGRPVAVAPSPAGTSVIAQTETPRPFVGDVIQAIGRPVAVAPSPAGTSVIAQTETPRPFVGDVKQAIGRPVAVAPSRAGGVSILARAEELRADLAGGRVVFAIGRLPAVVPSAPAAGTVVAWAQAPAPEAGLVLVGRAPAPPASAPIGGTVLVARAETPRQDLIAGLVVSAIGRPVAIAPSPMGTIEIARAETPAPEGGRVLIGMPPTPRPSVPIGGVVVMARETDPSLALRAAGVIIVGRPPAAAAAIATETEIYIVAGQVWWMHGEAGDVK